MGDSVTPRHRAIPEDKVRFFSVLSILIVVLMLLISSFGYVSCPATNEI